MILFKQKYDPNLSSSSEVIEKLQKSLHKIPEHQAMHVTMLVEDFISCFAEEDTEAKFTIQVNTFLGETHVKIFSTGEKFNPLDSFSEEMENIGIEDDLDPIWKIRRMLLQTYSDGITYARKKNKNILAIKISAPATKSLYLNLLALVVAIILGQLFRTVLPDSVNLALSTYLLTPVKDIFMNLLNLVMVPLVFFSIVTCVSGFTNLADLGRIGLKSFGLYLFTSVIAIVCAIAAYFVLTPSVQNIDISDSGSVELTEVSLSAVDTIVGIFPSNIISPFADADMLQLIFLGLLIGVCLTMMHEKAKPLCNIFEICNDLFMNIMGLIVRFLPLVTLATVTTIVIEMGIEVIISLLGLIACFVLGLLLIMLVYTAILVISSKQNPLPFFRKILPLLITAFSLSSSNATIPTTIDTCQKKLGVDAKISAFTIPLGATINMDGTCIYTMVSSLFLASAYGLEVTPSMLVTLSCVVFALSIGMPGVPGSGLIAISMAITQLGLPVEAVGIIIGIDRLGGMLRAMSNVLGDTAVTVSVASSEKLLDIETFKA